MNKRKIIVLILIAIVVIFIMSDVMDMITLDHLIENKDRLNLFTEKYFFASLFVYIVSYAFLAAIGLPVYMIFVLAAGIMFGFVVGMLAAFSAALLAAFLSFIVVKTFLNDYFRKKYAHRLIKFEKRIENKGFRILLGLRLFPGSPYFPISVMAGLSNMDLHTFLLATGLGILPSTSLFIYVGHALRNVNQISELRTFEFIFPIVLGVITLMVTVLLKLRKDKAI